MRSVAVVLALAAQASVVLGAAPNQCPFGWSGSTVSGDGTQCYKLVQTDRNWNAAEADCATQGGHLVSIRNQQEMELVYTLCSASPANRCWTGANDIASEGNWRWTDSTSTTFINSYWSTGQPDNAAGNQDCQVMWDAEDPVASADDDYCTRARHYICKAQAGCPPGEYRSGNNCLSCPAGRYSGSILNTGVAGCLGCDPGRYGATAGLTTPECTGKCANGHYCPSGSSTSATQNNCPPGRYGLTPAGASHGLGSAACSGNCDAGWYCGTEEITPTPSGQQCRAGYYGVGGESSDTCAGKCQAGFFCTVGSPRADQNACGAENRYCPEGSTTFTPVTAGHYSTPTTSPVTQRSGQNPCEPGYYCTAGRRNACPAGKWSGSTQATSAGTCGTCTQGFYCPDASTQPTETPCGAGQPVGQEAAVYCPAGTTTKLAVPSSHQSLPADAPLNQRWDTRPCPQGHRCTFGIAYPLIQFTSVCDTPAPTLGPFPGSTFVGNLFVNENQAFLADLTYVDQDAGVAPVFVGARPLAGALYGDKCPPLGTFATAFTQTAVTTNPLSGTIRVSRQPNGFNFEGCPLIGFDLVYAQGGFQYTCRIMTTVEDVNDSPVFTPDTTVRDIDENSKVGIPVGPRVLSTDEDDGQEVLYDFVAPSNSLGYFSISACSGQIFVADPAISYEQGPGIFLPFVDLVVRITDNGSPSLSAIRTVRVNINNINEPPIFITSTGSAATDDLGYGFTVSEDVSVPHVVGPAVAIDPDQFPLTWTLIQRNGQADFTTSPEFTVAPSTGVISAVRGLDFESVEQYAFTLRLADVFPTDPSSRTGPFLPGFDISLSNELVIDVLDANDPPIVTPVLLSVNEDAVNGEAAFGYISIVDPETDGRAAVTSVTLSGTGASFFNAVPLAAGAKGSLSNVTAYELVVTGTPPFDYETTPFYVFQVTVVDVGQGGLADSSTTITITMDVNDINEPPLFPASGPDPFVASVLENSFPGIALLSAPLTYVEPDGQQRATFRVDNYTSVFEIDPVQGMPRVLQDVLNFEEQSTYGLVLSAVDNGSPQLATTRTLAVNVINVNEPPTVRAGQVFTIAENTPADAVVGTVIVDDQDSLVPSEGESHTWKDLGGPGMHNPRAYFVVGQVQNLGIDLFKINLSTGELRVNDGVDSAVWTSLLDFEDIPSYTITVNVSDAGIAGGPVFTTIGTFEVQLTNVQEAPLLVPQADGSAQRRAVREQDPVGTLVGPPLQVLDQENQTVVCDFVTATTEWEFVPNSCQVRAAIPVMQAPGSVTLTREYTIRMTDNGTPPRTDTAVLNITIADSNFYPQFTPRTVSVREDAALLSRVGDIGMVDSVTDQDSDQTHQFFILDYTPVNTNTWFFVAAADIATGNISVGAQLNYEAHPVVQLGVQTQDSGNGGGLTNETVWTVNLLNVNEWPYLVAVDPITFPESTTAAGGSSVGTTVGTLTWTDEDRPDGDSWTLWMEPTLPGDPGFLTIDNAGVITVAQDVSHEAWPTLEYNVTICDAGMFLPPVGFAPGAKLCSSAPFSFIVADVNEPPSIVPLTLLVEEIAAVSSTLRTLVNGAAEPALIAWSDPDDPSTPFGQVDFSITGGDTVHFAITPSGFAILAAPVDFENQQAHAFTIQVLDNPGAPPSQRYAATADYTVQVLDDNDMSASVFNGGGQLVHPTQGTSEYVVFFNGTNMGPTSYWISQLADPTVANMVTYSALVLFDTGSSEVYPPATGNGGDDFKTVPCRRETPNTAIACAVPSGVGVLTWQLQSVTPVVDAAWNVVPGEMSTQLVTASGLTKYAAPAITGVSTSVAKLATPGGDAIVITGTNLGPADTQYANGDVRYGIAEPFFVGRSCLITVPHVQLTCESQDGVGLDMLVLLRTGGQDAPNSFKPASPPLSYSPPILSTVVVQEGALVKPVMATAGGDTLRVEGLNFGPSRLTLADDNGVAQELVVDVEVQYGLLRNQTLDVANTETLRFVALQCTHNVLPHTVATCVAPPGTGGNLVVRLAVKITYPGPVEIFQYSTLTPNVTVSYAPPVITEVSGPGSRNGITPGNEIIDVVGQNFGGATPTLDTLTGGACTFPLDTSRPGTTEADLPVLQYGRPAQGGRVFTAAACIVLSDTALRCCSAPGTGSQFQYWVDLDRQVSAPHYEPTSGYHPPVIEGYLDEDAAGTAELSATGGGSVVTIAGKNMGDATQWIDAVYYGKDGERDYTAASCFMLKDHEQVQCTTVQGAGAGLSWTVIVDGLQSEDPSTYYGPPTITGFAGPAAVGASTLGGEVVELLGYNFGPPTGVVSDEVPAGAGAVNKTHVYLDFVKYGPVTGQEYTADNCTVQSHTSILCSTVGGSGGNLTWTARVEGRTGPGSVAKWSYATPALTGIDFTPGGVPTTGGTLGSVQGTNLGTTDPFASAVVEVVLPQSGGAAIPVTVESMRVLAGGLEEISFFFPEGYGTGVQVRVVVNGAQVLVSNPMAFDYAAPEWDTYKVRGDTLAGFVRVEALGRNFARSPQNALGFQVAQVTSAGAAIEPDNLLEWDHSRIVFKLARPTVGANAGSGALPFAGESEVPVTIHVYNTTATVPVMVEETKTITETVTFVLNTTEIYDPLNPPPNGNLFFINGTQYVWFLTPTTQNVTTTQTSLVPSGNFSTEHVYHEASREVAMDPPSFASRDLIFAESLDTAGGTVIDFQVRSITTNPADITVTVGPGTLLRGAADGYAATTAVARDNVCGGVSILYCITNSTGTPTVEPACRARDPTATLAEKDDVFLVTCSSPPGQGTRNRLRVVFAGGNDIGVAASNSSADQVYMQYEAAVLSGMTYRASAAPLGRALQAGLVNGQVDSAGSSVDATISTGGGDTSAVIFSTPTDVSWLSVTGTNLGMSNGVEVVSFGGLGGALGDFLPRPPAASALNAAHTEMVVTVPPGINSVGGTADRQLQVRICPTYGCGTLAELGGQIGGLNFTAQEYASDEQAGDPAVELRQIPVPGSTPHMVAFTYASPVLNKQTIKVTTRGGDDIVLTGSNFGPASTAGEASITIGGMPCPLRMAAPGMRYVGPGTSAHTHLVCTMPAGVGGSMPVTVQIGAETVTVPGGFDPDFNIGYTPPTVLSMTPRTGPTTGDLNITLTGDNFGTDPAQVRVLLRSNPAEVADGRERDLLSPSVYFVNHTHISFTLPEGQGGDKVIEVQVGGQTSLVAPLQPAAAADWPPAAYSHLTFGYLPPRVVAVRPSCDTFGCTVTIIGENFGTRDCASERPTNNTNDLPVQVTMIATDPSEPRTDEDAQYECVPVCSGHTHEQFRCVLQPGMGQNLAVRVRIGSKTAPVDPAAGTYSFAAPILTSTVSSYVFASGAVNLTFYGKSMGVPGRAPAQVFLGGKECLNATVATIDAANRAQSLKCLRPETDTIGPKEVRFTMAFQDEQIIAPEAGLLQYNCPDGEYGQPGELCQPLPRGSEAEPHRVSCINAETDTLYGTEVCREYAEPVALPEHWRLNLTTPSRFCDQLGRGNRSAPYEGMCYFYVGCDPPDACAGNNLCSLGYKGERCGECIVNYFRLDGECQKCPSLAALYIVMFVLAIIAAAGFGYWLNKQNINLAFISIGVDYMQVLALFARTKVTWPPEIKGLFRFMSIFNLNIDLAAPECLSPNVKYDVKWTAAMVLPCLIAGVFFLVYIVNYAYKRWVKKVEADKRNSHMPQLVGSTLTMIYLLYLYLTRSTFDMFNCSPVDPDDGNVYLEVVFEKCWDSDLHNRLFPAAIVTLIVYVIAYPVLVGVVLYRNKDTVKVDQLLRAQFLGDDAKTSTRGTYSFRKMAEKLYRNFKPGKWYWQVVIIARKFAIAVTSLLFRRTPAYQMAMIVMVLFFSYAAQVKQRPYMSMSEYRAEVLYHEKKVLEGDPRHMKLDQDIRDAKKRAKKAARSKGTNMDRIRATRTKVGAASYVTNYNTVEMILLMCAILIALAGVMFDSRRFTDGKSPAGKLALTVIVMMLIISSLIYFVCVCVSEIMESVWPDTFAKTCKCCRATKSTIELEVEAGMMKGRMEAEDMGTAVNPLMMRKRSNTGVMDEDMLSQLNAILQAGVVPTHQQWQAIRVHVLGMRGSVGDLNNEIRALKKAQTLAAAKKSLGDNRNQKPKKKGRKKFAATASRSGTVAANKTKKQAWADAMKGGASKGVSSDTAALLKAQMAARGQQ